MGLRVPSSSSRTPVKSIDFFVFSNEFLSLEINSQNQRTPVKSGYLGAILESIFATMWPSCGHLGTTWGQVGSTLGCEHQSAEQHIFWWQCCWTACSFLFIKPVVFFVVLKSSARRTSKTQILWKCWNRSRTAPVRRNRSMWREPVRWGQSHSAKFLILHRFYNVFWFLRWRLDRFRSGKLQALVHRGG